MLAKDASEADFQSTVMALAKQYGWLAFHASPHQVGPIWRTDGRGFPDLVLAHPKRGVIFAELKTERGRLTETQADWGNALEPHVEYYCWRPSQLSLIAKRLGQSSWVS